MKPRYRPNCYECRHRGTIPGDCHSMCCHPATGLSKGANVFGALGNMFSGQALGAAKKLGVVGSVQGIRQGYFLWPANFDPVWLEACNGFEKA